MPTKSRKRFPEKRLMCLLHTAECDGADATLRGYIIAELRRTNNTQLADFVERYVATVPGALQSGILSPESLDQALAGEFTLPKDEDWEPPEVRPTVPKSEMSEIYRSPYGDFAVYAGRTKGTK